MKVKDFANKVCRSSVPFGVYIQRGMEKVEYIDDVKNIKSESAYLEETLNGFKFNETDIVLYIKLNNNSGGAQCPALHQK